MRKVLFAQEKRKPYRTLIQKKKGSFDSVISHPSRRISSPSHTEKTARLFSVFFTHTFQKTTSFLQSLIPQKKRRMVSDVTLQKRKMIFGSRASKNWIPHFFGTIKRNIRKESHQKKHLLLMFVAFGSKTSKSIVRTFAGNWRAQVSALLIILIIGGTYFSPFGAESATFTFTQNNWSGGVTANVPNHTSNRAGWTEYSAQSGLTVGTDVKLQVANYTFTDDGTTIPQNIASGGGFGNGTNASTMVVGSGAGASVSLSGVTTPVNTWDTVLKAVPGALSVDSTMIRNASDDTIYVTQG
ncbi:MAG: hypothetical protein GW815_01185, partial [Candidatus Moranbacteria bacterium]